MINIENKVIVWGGNHHNTLGVVRSLGEKGIKSHVIICNKTLSDSFILKSKYITDGVVLKSEKDCLKYIISNFANKSNKPIILCTSDSSSSCVDLNYDRLVKYFHIPNGGAQGKLTELMDKEFMSSVAIDVGLHVPRTWLIENNDIKMVEYPCITKPLKSIEGSKSDIVICLNKEELKTYLSGHKNSNKIQIQKYIDKDFEFQLIGCSINGGEKIIIPGYSKIIRSPEVTNTGFLEYSPLVNFDHNHFKSLEFIKECNYSGLFSLEFLRGKDGNDYFMEINFRNDGNAYAVTGGGVNLPYLWIASCLNLNISKEKKIVDKSIIVMPEIVDFFLMRKGKVSFLQWLKDLWRTDYFLLYNKYDKRPFYHVLQKTITSNIVKMKKKILK